MTIAPIERYLAALWERGGSDLLITAFSPPLMRIDGQLIPIPDEPELDQDHVEHLVLGVLTEDLKTELRTDREVDFSFSYNKVARFRGNCFFQMGALAMCAAHDPDEAPDLRGARPAAGGRVLREPAAGSRARDRPDRLGKSTSLAAIIDYINTNRHCHIITIEDPVEYVHPHKNSAVSQREVGNDTHSFARALRAALREDPDVILVGEMRDPETVQFALSIAETGHLVFATLHTNDAPQSLDRISDMFPAERQNQIRVQLAACLAGVISQRLVPRIGGGMVAAFEILIANNAVRSLVREGKTHQIRNVLAAGPRRGHVHARDLAQPPRRQRADHLRGRDVRARSHPKELMPPAGTKPVAMPRSAADLSRQSPSRSAVPKSKTLRQRWIACSRSMIACGRGLTSERTGLDACVELARSATAIMGIAVVAILVAIDHDVHDLGAEPSGDDGRHRRPRLRRGARASRSPRATWCSAACGYPYGLVHAADGLLGRRRRIGACPADRRTAQFQTVTITVDRRRTARPRRSGPWCGSHERLRRAPAPGRGGVGAGAGAALPHGVRGDDRRAADVLEHELERRPPRSARRAATTTTRRRR